MSTRRATVQALCVYLCAFVGVEYGTQCELVNGTICVYMLDNVYVHKVSSLTLQDALHLFFAAVVGGRGGSVSCECVCVFVYPVLHTQCCSCLYVPG